jgi:uridylate kinase
MRVLLKLSGEALAGDKKTGFDEETVRNVAKEVLKLKNKGTEIGIVIGGGNFWRGRTGNEIRRSKSDQIGMMATVMNCIYVSEIFHGEGMETEIYTPFTVGAFTKLYSYDEAIKSLSDGKIVFFAGGTGHPYFSTDTSTVLRAVETECDIILLAKAIDGVYTADPKTDPNAKRYDEISIQEIIDKKLGVIDLSASIMCMENKIPLRIFALSEKDGIVNAINDNFNGTKVTV